MDPVEVEYLDEEDKISIIPTFNYGVINLVNGDLGPFKAGIPTMVPLWVAVNLKKQQLCKIQEPDWMNVEKLEDLKNSEKNSKTFIEMPSKNYMTMAKLILGCASDDIPKADEIRTIIKDIWDMRMSKLRSSVDVLVRNTGVYAAVDNLTMMEINAVRPLFPHALDQIHRMKHNNRRADTQTILSNPSSASTTFHS